jgi:hypothetical protein
VTRPDGTLAGTFNTLQAAINAAPNGTATNSTRIFVRGRCVGKPAILLNRSNILIEGEPIPEIVIDPDNPFETNALGRCRRFGPRPDDLRSTLASDHSTPPSGSAGEVVKITGGANIRVRFLNIVDGATNAVVSADFLTQTAAADPHDGIEWKNSNAAVAFCNCIARNDEGLQLHDGAGHIVQQNLAIANLNGIHARVTTENSQVVRNRALLNRLVTSSEVEGDGIFLLEGTRTLNVVDNLACGNLDEGIGMDDADLNQVLRNRVNGNGFSALGAPLAGAGGVEVVSSDNNVLDDNCINANADMPPVAVDKARILSGSGNSGCNVTMPPACDPCTPPASLCTP